MIRIYYILTKPGIVFGNIITTAAAFLLASKGHFHLGLFLATLIGLSFIMASACVFNNFIDRSYDQKMERTKHRPLVTGAISLKNALIFANTLLGLGTLSLALYTNALAVTVALIGFVVYVLMYSFWKYKSVYGTLIGSVAGAVPPIVGYCAVSHTFDLGAWLLFAILVLWQMPHFYAIALYRLSEYKAANIPVLPLKKGTLTTKVHMLLYILAFMGTCALLTFFGYTGYAYLGATLLLGGVWLLLSVKGFKATNDKLWAKGMFRFSLVVIMALSLMISVDFL